MSEFRPEARPLVAPRRLAHRHWIGIGLWLIAALVVTALSPRAGAAEGPPTVDFERIARDLVAASPLADDGDAAARDAAGAALAHCDSLLDACGETVLWGGYDPELGYDPDAYTMTLFAPVVWARLYLSEFMFPGPYEIRREGTLEILELTAQFRRDLDIGDFPYPFWHSARKWRDYVNAESVIIVARRGTIVGAFRRADLDLPPLPRKWDGRWHWTTDDGATEPRVTLFEYLFDEDNPHRAPLESTYRELAGRFRRHGCIACHAPDNPAQASPLVLLLYPNQSLGARHEIVSELRRNRMPPSDPILGLPRGIPDEFARGEMLELAEAFAKEGDAALAFERAHAGTDDVAASATDEAEAAWKTVSDDWYTLTLAGEHAGWMRVAREDDGARYRTVTEMTLAFHQHGLMLDSDSYVEWIETHDGEPVHLQVARRNKEKLTNFTVGSTWEATRNGDPNDLLTSKREWAFDGDRVVSVIHHDGEITRVPTSRPAGPWLTPVAAERFIRQRINDGARLIEYGTVDAPLELRYVGVRSMLVGRSEFAYDGAMIPVTVWRTKTTVNPATTISHFSSDGKLLFSSVDLGLGVLETRLSGREEALSLEAATATEVAMLPAVPYDGSPPGTDRAVYTLRYDDGTPLPPLPSAGAQRVVMSDDGRVATITVDATETSPVTGAELAECRQRERAPIVGSDDPVVLELAAAAIREATGLGPAELATSARTVVQRHFAAAAPASPAISLAVGGLQLPDAAGARQARTLAAVLRVHRIPSRLVSGLAWEAGENGGEDGSFRWRVWTQALLEDRWGDLDATQPESFEATHILTGIADIDVATPDPDPLHITRSLSRMRIDVIVMRE